MILTGTAIDWGNSGFLRLYGLVFGLATVFTMVMWLVSVVKRVVRGVPLGQAAMENVGYLLMSVSVAAFAPVLVAYTVDFVDSAAEAILGEYIAEVFVGGLAIFVLLSLIASTGFGLIIAIPILLMLLLALFGLWIMLVVRSAMIMMGLIFGPLVFSGLVDKDLWGHTRKWVGIMGGLIASKLGIYLALALAGAILGGATDYKHATLPQAIGGSITFLALFGIALFMPFQIAKWLPFVGDEIQAMHQVKGEAVQQATAVGQKHDDMMTRAADKKSAGGGAAGAGSGGATAGGIGAGAAGAAGGPALAGAMAAKQAIDTVRDQTIQAAQDGANNASGDGDQQGSDSKGGSSGAGGNGGSGAAWRPAPPPPPRPGSRPGSPPPPPTPPPRPGGQTSPPPSSPPPPGR
ncbi:hypothetical protein [Streptomyces sp. NPDC058371]|uniref:hypothetical protein n=1 Tax=Streptomyces sp. NPDC058371 TaxID=3346463 RepID=UPI00366A10CD